MSNQNIEFIKLLQNQKAIRILFIFLNIFAWFGDNLTQQDLINNEQKNTEKAQSIYNFILIISIIVNIYYIIIIQDQINSSRKRNENTKQLKTKKNALIILVVALFTLLYTQLPVTNNQNNTDDFY